MITDHDGGEHCPVYLLARTETIGALYAWWFETGERHRNRRKPLWL